MQIGSDIRILVVDHERNTTHSVAAELRRLGNNYIVDTANSPNEAFMRIRQIEYHLVIADFEMPEMEGEAFIRKLQNILPSLKIIVMAEKVSARVQRDLGGKLKLEGFLEKPFSPEQIRRLVQKTIEQMSKKEAVSVQAPPKPEQKTSVTRHPLPERLEKYRGNTNARCVLILSNSGHIMSMVGDTADLDTNSISALVAANFMAGIELLGKMLGNESVFKTSYYEGPDYNIFAHSIDSNYLLAIIFGHESKQGVIRFYVNKLIEDLIPILKDKLMISQNVTTNTLDEDFSQGMISDLDKLFSVPDKSSTK